MRGHAWRRIAYGCVPLVTSAIVSLAAPAPLRAQVAAPSAVVVQQGETVRLRAGMWEYTGILARIAGDTAVIRFVADSAVVPLAGVQRVQVQRGTRRSVGHIVIGTTLGIAVGALVGGYTGVLVECGTSCGDDGGWAGLAGMAIGSTTGALVGGITGGVLGGRKRYPRFIPAVLPERTP
jgi:hypothetical protein